MLSLSQTAGYAIQALSSLIDSGNGPGFIKDVAERSGVPAPYLAKIFKRLNDAGSVGSKRGLKGGVWLAKAPSEITLLDVSNAVDGPGWLSACLLGNAVCSDERSCPSHAFWKKERERIQAELQGQTLESVASFYGRQKHPVRGSFSVAGNRRSKRTTRVGI
jgi:Rrf2 family iron-sulfur cluster assembly transcriptional regulator